MSNRVINVDVSDSYISMTGDTAGASGAMKATTMRMTFDDHWAGTSKTIYFTDALGEASVSVLLSADALVDGTAATYDVPIPAEAMTAEGLASVTVCGIALAADNVTVIRKITTKAAKFRVMDSEIPSSASNEAAVTATDKQQMQSALDKVTNMSVEASALAPGSAATVAKGADAAGNVKLSFGIPKGDTGATGPQGLKGDTGEKGDTGATGPQGPKGETGATGSPGRDGTNGIDGEDGRGIVSIVRTSGNGAAGTTDTYTVTYTDTTTSTFKVYNGADGTGAGDMLASVYDPAGKNAQMAVMSDIPTTLPASDVPAWAKAATKPSYTPAEVGAAPSVHTHTAEQVGADPSGSAAAVQAKLDAHAGNTTVHLTAAERTAWNGKANTVTLTCTVPVAWTASGDFFYQNVSVPGMLASDNPTPGILFGGDNAANKLYDEAFGKVLHITTYDNLIQVWCTEAPTVAFPVQFKVVR